MLAGNAGRNRVWMLEGIKKRKKGKAWHQIDSCFQCEKKKEKNTIRNPASSRQLGIARSTRSCQCSVWLGRTCLRRAFSAGARLVIGKGTPMTGQNTFNHWLHSFRVESSWENAKTAPSAKTTSRAQTSHHASTAQELGVKKKTTNHIRAIESAQSITKPAWRPRWLKRKGGKKTHTGEEIREHDLKGCSMKRGQMEEDIPQRQNWFPFLNVVQFFGSFLDLKSLIWREKKNNHHTQTRKLNRRKIQLLIHIKKKKHLWEKKMDEGRISLIKSYTATGESTPLSVPPVTWTERESRQ